MKALGILFSALLAFSITAQAAAGASSIQKTATLQLGQVRVAVADTVAYCRKNHTACSIAVLDSHDVVKMMVLMRAALPFSLLQAHENATVALSLKTDIIHLAQYSGNNLRILLAFAREIVKNPNFMFEQGGRPIFLKGQIVGALGISVANKRYLDSHQVGLYFDHDFQMLNTNPTYYKVQNEKLLRASKQPQSHYANALLASSYAVFPQCSQYQIACSVSIVDTYGAIVFQAVQDQTSQVNVILSTSRAISSGTTGLHYGERSNPEQALIQSNLIGYSFMRRIPMLPVTPGSYPWIMNHHLVGGVGVSSSLRGASPLYWQRYNRLIATQTAVYIQKHYHMGPENNCVE